MKIWKSAKNFVSKTPVLFSGGVAFGIAADLSGSLGVGPRASPLMIFLCQALIAGAGNIILTKLINTQSVEGSPYHMERTLVRGLFVGAALGFAAQTGAAISNHNLPRILTDYKGTKAELTIEPATQFLPTPAARVKNTRPVLEHNS